MKIGFPRALFYYDYFPFWAGFFDELRIEVVTSPPTQRKIMEDGLHKASDETCLPLKLLAGHIQALNGVDAIFLPRLVSMEKGTYNCPKFLGIPESLLSAVPPGIPVLSVDINWRKGEERKVFKALLALGTQLGKGKAEVRRALQKAQEWQRSYLDSRGSEWSFEKTLQEIELSRSQSKDQSQSQSQSLAKGLSTKEGLSKEKGLSKEANLRVLSGLPPLKDTDPKPLKIMLAGHSYLVQEEYASLNLLKRLQEKADVVLAHHVENHDLETQLSGIRKKLFWSHAKQIYGAGSQFAKDSTVDGIIYLTCFGCGTDSMIQELLAKNVREEHKPYMVITVDEHTGEAGLVTRLEAFLDMVERRKDRESYLSANG